MRTRSKNKNKKVLEIIEIESEPEQHICIDSSSEVSCSDSYSQVEQDSQNFVNLAPVQNAKRKKNLGYLKNLFLNNSPETEANQEQRLQRAPILNLLRPIQNTKNEQSKSQFGPQSQASIEPPSLHDSQQEIDQMSQPKKKPKLMQEIEEHLNLAAEEYRISGVGREVREQRKKDNKKRDYLIDKKFKEYKVGKKKDKVSNQVFNAIEDFFA